MKKIILITALMSMPLVSYAFNEHDIRFTVHNLAYNTDVTKGLVNNGVIATNERNIYAANSNATQVCVFCHTPHNAGSTSQLWNQAGYNGSAPSSYRMYTSATIHSATRSAKLTASSESMLCLTCHDGKTAINVLHNSLVKDSNIGNKEVLDINGMASGAFSYGDIGFPGLAQHSNIGASRNADTTLLDPKYGLNLTDDHPIGFSYSAVQTDKPNELRTVAVASANKVRFFGATSRMECSTCHDPHVFYGYVRNGASRVPIDTTGRGGGTLSTSVTDRTPFLVRDNNGSALCLACHIK